MGTSRHSWDGIYFVTIRGRRMNMRPRCNFRIVGPVAEGRPIELEPVVPVLRGNTWSWRRHRMNGTRRLRTAQNVRYILVKIEALPVGNGPGRLLLDKLPKPEVPRGSERNVLPPVYRDEPS